MALDLFLWELSLQLYNIYNDYFYYLLIYFLNFIYIIYLKLDQDSKNAILHYLTFNRLKEATEEERLQWLEDNKKFTEKDLYDKKMGGYTYITLIKFKGIKNIIKSNKINFFKKNSVFTSYYVKNSLFYKVNDILNYLNINKKLFFNISLNYFKFIQNLSLNKHNIFLYYDWIILVLNKYNLLYSNLDNMFIYNNNYIFYPNNILLNIKLNHSDIKSQKFNDMLNFEKYLIRLYLNFKKQKFIEKKEPETIMKNKYYFDNFLTYYYNYSDSGFKLNFLRIQRRYNKRRYSKVRVSSRNSFFAGISLSSIMIAILWGGSIKNVDWFISKIIVIDINLIIFILFLYFTYRLYIVYNPSIFIRKKNKIRIVSSIQKLFIINLWFKK